MEIVGIVKKKNFYDMLEILGKCTANSYFDKQNWAFKISFETLLENVQFRMESPAGSSGWDVDFGCAS